MDPSHAHISCHRFLSWDLCELDLPFPIFLDKGASALGLDDGFGVPSAETELDNYLSGLAFTVRLQKIRLHLSKTTFGAECFETTDVGHYKQRFP